MVLGILSAIAACPAIVGTTEAVRQGQKAQAKDRHRGQKTNLVIKLPAPNAYSRKFEGALVVLKDNKLYVQHTESKFAPGTVHPFAGYYLPYPSNQSKWVGAGYKGEGLVSTINDENHLNWVYVDRKTHEAKYGVRAEAEANCTGPWDCTEVDKRLIFEGWEGFILVQEDEKEDLWCLYFDRFDDGLSSEGRIGDFEATGKPKRMLEVQLVRREMPKDFDMAQEERVERLKALAGKQKEQQENGLVNGGS